MNNKINRVVATMVATASDVSFNELTARRAEERQLQLSARRGRSSIHHLRAARERPLFDAVSETIVISKASSISEQINDVGEVSATHRYLPP
jgi:hypothetical protein